MAASFDIKSTSHELVHSTPPPAALPPRPPATPLMTQVNWSVDERPTAQEVLDEHLGLSSFNQPAWGLRSGLPRACGFHPAWGVGVGLYGSGSLCCEHVES